MSAVNHNHSSPVPSSRNPSSRAASEQNVAQRVQRIAIRTIGGGAPVYPPARPTHFQVRRVLQQEAHDNDLIRRLRNNNEGEEVNPN